MTGVGNAMSDAELVAQCVDGSRPSAFEDLVDRYGERLYRVVHRLVGDAEMARDLTQDTFLKAWRGLPSFSGSSSFYTWIYRIARNVVTSEYRRLQARPRVVRSLDAGPNGGSDDASERLDVADDGEGPRSALMSKERREAVTAAIVALVPEFREIIVLRDIEKHSYEDIAEMLTIPVGTVRSRLHRARMELKASLGGAS